MIEEELRSLLAARGLDRVTDQLMALAAPTIRIYIQGTTDENLPTGASKVGGLPDLPTGTDWPFWHEHMAFIAQINMQETAPYDLEGALPSSGLLSFFWETNGEPLYAARWGLPESAPYHDRYPDLERSWRVLYHDGPPETFVRREFPDDVHEYCRFPACAARFASEVTLPDANGAEIAQLHLTVAEREALIGLEVEVNRGTWNDGGHHLLGYPYSLLHSTLVECDMESRGIPWRTWAKTTSAERLETAQDVSRRWRLLLQIDSSDTAAMDWAGGGLVHYCIEHDALAGRDFSRAWLNMQFL
ncbi:MAG: YwqG family protein [Chloroflexota bacterium]